MDLTQNVKGYSLGRVPASASFNENQPHSSDRQTNQQTQEKTKPPPWKLFITVCLHTDGGSLVSAAEVFLSCMCGLIWTESL